MNTVIDRLCLFVLGYALGLLRSPEYRALAEWIMMAVFITWFLTAIFQLWRSRRS